MKHREQRVLVLFDVQNMYYSGKQLYNSKVKFMELLKKAVSGRKLIRAIAYVIKTDIKEESNFHDALHKMGIEVKAKDIQIFLGGAKKGDWDIGIAMDAVRLSPKVDTVVLITGDGDFKDLVQYLQSHGCRAEAIGFGQTTSKHLKEVVDDFFDLETQPAKYLINYKGKVKHTNLKHPQHAKHQNQSKHPQHSQLSANQQHSKHPQHSKAPQHSKHPHPQHQNQSKHPNQAHQKPKTELSRFQAEHGLGPLSKKPVHQKLESSQLSKSKVPFKPKPFKPNVGVAAVSKPIIPKPKQELSKPKLDISKGPLPKPVQTKSVKTEQQKTSKSKSVKSKSTKKTSKPVKKTSKPKLTRKTSKSKSTKKTTKSSPV